jgi:uncharacterized LabA/DUF88 family protein
MYSSERVVVYIDGFNLYFGMTTSFPDIKWLDVELLAKNLLKPNQTLVCVKYFTSLVNHNPQKEKRQQAYLNALKSTDVKIIYGHYKSKPKSCKSCGHSWNDNEEKMTDVNIAVHMVADAIDDLFDCAILISGDSDLVPPITLIHSKFNNKRVTVVFPPNRHNNSVKNVAKGSFILGKQKLKQSQFPEKVKLKNGFVLQKPNEWK